MTTITEGASRASTQAAANPSLPLTNVRPFTIDQIGIRLASEPGLVGRFWDQIAKSDGPRDLTVFYCSVGWRGEIYSVMEFVAGETLEQFVKRSDPAVCEQELPLFCKLLDAFEGAAAKPVGKTAHTGEVELLDFGVARAASSVKMEAHGAVLAGHDGTWSEAVFGASGPNQVRPLLMELSANLPGGFQHPAVPGAAAIGECAIQSLATPLPIALAASAVPPPMVKPGFLSRLPVSPYVIGVGTTLLMLTLLYGVGGFLARRSVPSNAGKLNLPPISEPVAAAPDTIPLSLEPEPAPPAVKKQPKLSNGTIVLTRGARPIVQTKLQYPADARKERITGVVEMQLTIAEDGTVHSPRVLSGDPLLGAGLAEQISKWVYQPLRVNGKAVPMTTELAIRFDLNP